MSSVALIDAACVEELLAEDPLLVKDLVRESLRVHHAGSMVLPLKQYLQRSPEAHTADRIIAMPVYLSQPQPLAGIKWIGSHPANHARGLERANALIVLNDTTTNAPLAVVSGSLISALRTFAMTLLCLDRFLGEPRRLALLGMGRLGRLHARLLPRLYPSIEQIRCYSRADYRDLLAEAPLLACDSPEQALEGADALVTVTAANQPYLGLEAVRDVRLIVNLSLMDCRMEVYGAAAAIVVDDLAQCRSARKVFRQALEAGVVDAAAVLELSELLFGAGRERQLEGQVLVNPIGMAVEDILVAQAVYERVRQRPDLPVFVM